MKKARLNRKGTSSQEMGLIILLFVIGVLFSLLTHNTFAEPSNLVNVLRQFSEISIMAIGMTFVIISAEIDLSVGSTYGLSAIIAAYLLHNSFSPFTAFMAALLIGIGIGFINGILTTKGKIPSFIVTLAMLLLVRGAAFAISHGWPISEFPDTNNWFFYMGSSIGGVIPVQILIMIALNVLGGIVLSKTSFGFKVYAVGGNKQAARLTGINVDRVKIVSFILAGAFSALAGMIGLAYLNSVAATAGQGREMDVIAAVILGGTNLSGGRGSILGTFLGAAIIGVLRNGMVLLGVEAYYQEALVGLIILVVVLIDTWLTKKEKVR